MHAPAQLDYDYVVADDMIRRLCQVTEDTVMIYWKVFSARARKSCDVLLSQSAPPSYRIANSSNMRAFHLDEHFRHDCRPDVICSIASAINERTSHPDWASPQDKPREIFRGTSD